MANWKSTVDVYDIHLKVEENTITVPQAGKMLAERLRKNRYAPQIDDIIDMFENAESTEEYDWALGELYDFGDEGHRIWVNSIGPTRPTKVLA